MTTLENIKAGANQVANTANHPILGKTTYLEKRKDLLGAGIPGHMTVEREIRTATVMLMQSADLQAAKPETFYVAVSIAINSGIGLGMGRGYLVAYKGNVSYVPGWKGLIDLVNRTGRASAWTGVVHKGDHFEYALGDSPFLTHKPGDNEEFKDITHYYAIGRVKGAEYPHIVVWSVNKVIKHLTQFNKVGGRHYALKDDTNMEAYGRKVVLLQVIKYLPTSQDLENALAADVGQETGKKVTIDGNFVYVEEGDGAEQPGEAEPIPRNDVQPEAAAAPTQNERRRDQAETVEARPTKAATITEEDSETYERVAAILQKAHNPSQLADAYEMIGDVKNNALSEQLTSIHKQRLAEFSKKPEPEAAAKRTKRSAPAPE